MVVRFHPTCPERRAERLRVIIAIDYLPLVKTLVRRSLISMTILLVALLCLHDATWYPDPNLRMEPGSLIKQFEGPENVLV